MWNETLGATILANVLIVAGAVLSSLLGASVALVQIARKRPRKLYLLALAVNLAIPAFCLWMFFTGRVPMGWHP